MRKTVGMILGLSVILALCGCGREKEITKNNKEETEKLVIWSYYETQAQRNALNELIRDFNQSQKQYEASWEYVPMTAFARGLSSAYTENKLPDMVIIDNPDMPSMIKLGLFENITDRVQDWNLDEEYYSSIISTVNYEGQYYGIPLNCNSTALIYNKEMLEKADLTPPETWEDFEEAARKLTTEEHCGFTMCGMEGEQGAFQILSWILADGGDTADIKGRAWTDTFDFFGELLKEGSMSESCINLTQTDVARKFVQGETAMMQNGPWVFPMLDEAGIDYEITSIPGINLNAAVLGGENIAVMKGKNTNGSLEFLDFCMNGEELLDFCEASSVLPAKISAAEKLAEQNPKMKVFVEQMEHAVTRTSVPQWEQAAQGLTDEMYRIVEKK